MNTEFGLNQKTIEKLRNTFAQFPAVDRVLIYGSRAKGNFKPGSDIDLTLVGQQLKLETLLKIENDLDDLLLPYKIDLSIYDNIEETSVREHIERVGKVFYRNCSGVDV